MQSSLFDTLDNPSAAICHQLEGGSLDEHPAAFSLEEAIEYKELLMKSTPWRQDFLRIAGKKIAVPRLQCWMGDARSKYGYSGMRLTPEPWTSPVNRVRQRLKEITGHDFNSVLLNLYRNGQDSVAWHADDEPELGPDPVIASVSFGCERTFELKPKHKRSRPAEKHTIVLRNGSILVMKNNIQSNWLHKVPKVKHEIGERINLTFRNIVEYGE